VPGIGQGVGDVARGLGLSTERAVSGMAELLQKGRKAGTEGLFD
jgi:hypothetical protein